MAVFCLEEVKALVPATVKVCGLHDGFVAVKEDDEGPERSLGDGALQLPKFQAGNSRTEKEGQFNVVNDRMGGEREGINPEPRARPDVLIRREDIGVG